MIPIRPAAFILTVLAVVSAPFAAALPDEDTYADVYQIVHAGPDRVWRLNKKTGEVMVCTLENDHLVCVPGVEAPKSQSPTFGQIEAERARTAAEAEQRRKEENAKRMAVLDRMIAAFPSSSTQRLKLTIARRTNRSTNPADFRNNPDGLDPKFDPSAKQFFGRSEAERTADAARTRHLGMGDLSAIECPERFKR